MATDKIRHCRTTVPDSGSGPSGGSAVGGYLWTQFLSTVSSRSKSTCSTERDAADLWADTKRWKWPLGTGAAGVFRGREICWSVSNGVLTRALLPLPSVSPGDRSGDPDKILTESLRRPLECSAPGFRHPCWCPLDCSASFWPWEVIPFQMRKVYLLSLSLSLPLSLSVCLSVWWQLTCLMMKRVSMARNVDPPSQQSVGIGPTDQRRRRPFYWTRTHTQRQDAPSQFAVGSRSYVWTPKEQVCINSRGSRFLKPK